MSGRIIFLFLIVANVAMGDAGAYLGSAAGIQGAPLRLTSSGCAIVQTPAFGADRAPTHVFCL